MHPFEFTVEGPPVSLQTKNRARLQAWKNKVYKSANSVWPSGDPPINGEVTIKIIYFYDTAPPDVNNIIKPIQDALNGLVYVDDSQVAQTSSKKSNINGAFKIRGAPEHVAVQLAKGKEFLFIRILPAPDHEDLS